MSREQEWNKDWRAPRIKWQSPIPNWRTVRMMLGFLTCLATGVACLIAALVQLLLKDSAAGALFNLLGAALWLWIADRILRG